MSHFAGNLHIRRLVPAEFAAVFDQTGGMCSPKIIIMVIECWLGDRNSEKRRLENGLSYGAV